MSVTVTVQHVSGRQLEQLELEPDPARGAQSEREQRAQTRWAVDRERPLAPAEIECLQQARQAQPMISMEMGQVDLGEVEQPDRAHELTLSPLSAVEQDAIASPANQHRGQSTARGGDRAGGSGEEHWRDPSADQSVSRV